MSYRGTRGVQAGVAVVVAAGVFAAVGDTGAATGPSAAAPAAAAEVTVGINDAALLFAPAEITISVGDSVTWDFDGSKASHNAAGQTTTSSDTSWSTFDTGFKQSGQSTPRQFTATGEYTFICLAHPSTMRGKITVVDGPTTQPTRTPRPITTPTATATPVVAAATPVPTATINTPAPLGASRLDTTAPAISKLKLKAVKGGAKVSFSLSESASVTLRVKRAARTVGTIRVAERAGSRSLTLRRMAKGRYSVEIEARDARGNKAAVQRKSVRVTR